MNSIPEEELLYLEKVRNFIDNEILKDNNLTVELENQIMDEGQKYALDNPYGSLYAGHGNAGIIGEFMDYQLNIEKKIIKAETAKQEAYFLGKIRSHPYFSRVDFKEEDYDEESFYIGLKTLFEESELTPYVYDWRAPVAALFYEDFESEAYYSAPQGKIEGEIIRKRQFKFSKDGEIESCFDSTFKVDDDILQKALSESSTDRLKVIVSSIQKEQNKAIRFGEEKNLIVSGPAGSGKTSVGFHRIAYLLYKCRENLSSGEVVMFTGSDIFTSYVSDIIPELGEAPIKDYNFYNLLKEQSDLEYNDYYSLAEAFISKDRGRTAFAEIKYSSDFISFLEQKVSEIVFGFSDFYLLDDVVYSKADLIKFLKKRTKTKTYFERLSALQEYAEDKIDLYFSENYQKIYDFMDEQSDILEDTNECVEEMRNQIKQDAKTAIENELRGNDYEELLKIYYAYNKEMGEDFERKLSRGFIDFEDALLVVYIRVIMGKIAQRIEIRHVLIDEAQDFSPIQHRIIRYLYPKAKFTVLTDSNQAIVPCVNTTNLETLREIYSAEILKMGKSYRQTKQLGLYSRNLLENPEYEIFERDGEEPEITSSDNVREDILKEIESAEGTVCVITKTTSQARLLWNDLILDTDIDLYDDKDKCFSSKVAIMPLVYTKGLEFDNVIIVEEKNNSFFGEENKPYLYMAATRALHRLKILKTE